jgi:hypothetical protein
VPDDGQHDVPVSVVPRLTFAVPLDPATVGPDAFRLWSGALEPGGTVSWSVVDRTLTFVPSVTLRTRLAYAARLAAGVRGIDGSVPEEPVELVFVTGNADLGRPPAPPNPSFAADIVPLVAARCAACHGGEPPAAGLPLDTPEALLDTAVRASSEWLGWAVVRAGSPERSYLLYKVTGAPGLLGSRMPPEAPLTRDEAWALERWIALGAVR